MRVRLLSVFGLLGALVVGMIAATSAVAAQPNQQAMNDMGLGSLVVMSDSEALAVRGMGYRSSRHSSSRAWGSSSAEFELPFGLGEAESENGYSARGRHRASGDNGSHAGVELDFDGEIDAPGFDFEGEVYLKIKVFAGGGSSARSF